MFMFAEPLSGSLLLAGLFRGVPASVSIGSLRFRFNSGAALDWLFVASRAERRTMVGRGAAGLATLPSSIGRAGDERPLEDTLMPLSALVADWTEWLEIDLPESCTEQNASELSAYGSV
jgi:hypothetical protein